MNVRLFDAAELPAPDRREIFRYARSPHPGAEEERILDECLDVLLPELTYRAVWAEFPVETAGKHLHLGFTETDSAALSDHLRSCETYILFAATIGIAPDRLAQKFSRISPVKALFFEASGNERIEALCDAFCREFPGAGRRFSPGYGDLPLELQREILQVLDCPRKIGLTLNESLLMTPAKSVTALFGINNKELI